MIIYKKVKLDKNERNLIKASLLLRGVSYREYIQDLTGKKTKTTGHISNILTTGIVTRKQYEKILKPLNLPFFKDFKWQEEVTTIRTKIDID